MFKAKRQVKKAFQLERIRKYSTISHLNIYRLRNLAHQIQCQYFRYLSIDKFLCKQVRHRHRFVWPPVLQPHEIKSIIQYGVGGFVVITGSNNSLVSSHFQPYSFGSDNSGDGKCEDFHWNAVKWARISICLNALWVGGNLFDSLWCIENRCYLKAPSVVTDFGLCFM